jgi:molybdopterin-guanine dinucleotide biosynthesis protein A
VIGVVVAGGLGARMGVPKPTVLLAGRPLIDYPLDALRPVCERLAVVCKRDTELPPLGDVERWDEPDDPRHPIAGILHALERSGSAILVCGADMPFVTADVCRQITSGLRPGTKAAVAASAGRLQPLLAAYADDALEVMRMAPGDEPLTWTVESLMPVRIDVEPEVVFNVNTPEDLAEAERRLRTR